MKTWEKPKALYFFTIYLKIAKTFWKHWNRVKTLHIHHQDRKSHHRQVKLLSALSKWIESCLVLLVVSISFHLIVRFKERASLFFGKRLMTLWHGATWPLVCSLKCQVKKKTMECGHLTTKCWFIQGQYISATNDTTQVAPCHNVISGGTLYEGKK